MIDRSKYLDKTEIKLLRTTSKNQSRVDVEDGKQTGPLAWMLVDLALKTGLRVSEMASIKKQDIDFKRQLIRIVRLKRRRRPNETQDHYNRLHVESLAVSPELQRHLKNYIKRSGKKTGFLVTVHSNSG